MSASWAEHHRRLSYQGLLLGIVAFVASSTLLVAHQITGPAIAARNAEDLAASLSQVLPSIAYDNDLAADTVQITMEGAKTPTRFYRARQQGEVQAIAFETVGYGYSGAIRLVMGIDVNGRILAVRVLAHRETPGLGDKIELAKSRWIESFNGLTRHEPHSDQWKVKKDGGRFDQFTGATITPRAVVKAVKEGLDLFAAHKASILAGKPTEAAP